MLLLLLCLAFFGLEKNRWPVNERVFRPRNNFPEVADEDNLCASVIVGFDSVDVLKCVGCCEWYNGDHEFNEALL